jgi:polyisoprenoid-binding protein YceI
MNPGIEKSRWLLLALAVMPILAALPVRALDTYDIDPAHSNAGFKARHLFGQVPGRFTDFSGVLQYDPATPQNSTIEITIQAKSISTDNEMRDNHLRSADFFDVATYPTITFKSTQIAPGADQTHFNVTGNLTIRGVTKPVIVAVEVLGFGDTPMGYRGGFSATTTINRQDFGVKWNKILDTGGTLLGDQVQIDFPLEVVKRKA